MIFQKLLFPAMVKSRLIFCGRQTVTPKGEYRAVVLLIGPDGQSWSPAGTARPSGYEPPPPSTGWRGGQYVFDPHIVSLLPGTPPGSYQLEVVIFDKETLTPLPVCQ